MFINIASLISLQYCFKAMSETQVIEQVLNISNSILMHFPNVISALSFIQRNDAKLRYLNVSYNLTKQTAYCELQITKHIKEVI